MPSGSLKNVLVERVDSIETTMAHIIPEFTSNLLVPLALLGYLFVLDWRMALAVLVTVPIGFGCYALMSRGYAESYQNTVDKTKILNDTAVEYINGIEVIKAFGKAQSSYDKFVVAARDGASCYVEWMRRCNIYFCLDMSIFPATMVAVLPIGGLLFRAGTLDAGTFIQVIIFSVGLLASLISVMSYADDLAKLSTIIGEVTDILKLKDQERPQISTAMPLSNDIALHQVKFGYHDKEVLHGIDLQIKEDTVNALVGPSGSGKSTIAKLIAGLWDVDSGKITIGGVDIRSMTQMEHNQRIAYVSQDNFLFDTTVLENIRMGRQSATDEEVIEAAKQCGCHDFIMSLENGYQTMVGGAGGHLSGGERQRISIARAIMKDAPIIILDEATANVDTESEQELTEAIEALTREKTILMIAHRLKTARHADNILVIDNGKIIQSGTHEHLMEQGGIYRRFVESRELAIGWKV